MEKINFKLVAVGEKTYTKESIMRIRISKGSTYIHLDLPSSLQFRAALLRDKLVDAGANLPSDPKDATDEVVARIVSKLKSVKQIDIIHSTGWYGERTFVLPSETISLKPSKIVFDEAVSGCEHGIGRGGDAKIWDDAIRTLIARSDYGLLVVAVALAGPALNILGESESLIFNGWSEDSSTGKTTLLLVLTSVYGKSIRRLLTTFELTPRAREEAASSFNSLAKAIDEMALGGTSLLTPKDKEAFAMMLAGGGGKKRSNVVASTLPNLTWQGAFLTSGNMPAVKGKAKGENSGPTAVRWLDFKVPPKKNGGILNKGVTATLPSNEVKRNAKFLQEIEETLSKNYGHLGPAWIKHLVHKRNGATKRLRELAKQFMQDNVHTDQPSELRIGKKWAGISAIAQYAAEKKLVPWTPDDGRASIAKIYRLYLRDLGKSPERHQRAVKKLLALVKSGDGFTSYSTRSLKRKSHAAPEFYYGFKIQLSDGTWALCIDPSKESDLSVKLGLGADELKNVLRDEGLICQDAEGKSTRMQRLPWMTSGSRVRMRVIHMRQLRAFMKRQTQ